MLRPRSTVCGQVLGGLLGCALSLPAGCAYPTHATPLTTVMHSPVDRSTQPDNLWQLQIVEAQVPRQTRTGQSWDDEGGGPDVYFVLAINGEERWRTEVMEDNFRPRFPNPSPNLRFDRNRSVRLELWDRDGVGADPIGIYEGRVLSEVFIDADSNVTLEGGAGVTVRLRKPEPRAGTGVAEYELRPSALVVRAVLPNSPAERGGLRNGDRIVAIDGKAIASLSEAAADSALALASQRASKLTAERDGKRRTVQLDSGYVWPAQ